MNKDLHEMLLLNEYYYIRELDNGIVIALHHFMFTVGLCYNLHMKGYEVRYCYSDEADAIHDVLKWDGKLDPPGLWVAKK